MALSLLGCVTNRPLRGVNFYVYSVSGDDSLSVIRDSGVSVLEGLPIYGFLWRNNRATKICPLYRDVHYIEGCPLSGVSLYSQISFLVYRL